MNANATAVNAASGKPDSGEILEAALIGAIAAVAFTVGVAFACPKEGLFDTLFRDILSGAFGGALGELLNQLTNSPLLSSVLSAFMTGFIFELIIPEECPR